MKTRTTLILSKWSLCQSYDRAEQAITFEVASVLANSPVREKKVGMATSANWLFSIWAGNNPASNSCNRLAAHKSKYQLPSRFWSIGVYHRQQTSESPPYLTQHWLAHLVTTRPDARPNSRQNIGGLATIFLLHCRTVANPILPTVPRQPLCTVAATFALGRTALGAYSRRGWTSTARPLGKSVITASISGNERRQFNSAP